MRVEYRLRHKESGKYLTYFTSSNVGGYACNDEEYILDLHSPRTYILELAEHAEWVKHNSAQCYNSTYNTPTHDFKADELEIVKVEIIETETPLAIKLPTVSNIYKHKARRNKGYLDILTFYIKDCLKQGINPDTDYSMSYYDLTEYLRDIRK